MKTLTHPTALADTSKMTRPEWLRARRSGIGGSDAAAIMGVSPWASQYSLWMDKTGQPIEKAETPAMRFGNLMEPVIREQYEFIQSVVVLEDKTLYQHPVHKFMLANLDGVVFDPATKGEPLGILEIKTSRHTWDEVPAHYYAQVQHYLAVTNLEMAWVAALFGGETLETFDVPRNDAYIERLIEAEAEFWQKVQDAQRPDVDGTEATHDALRKAWSPEPGKVVQVLNLDDLVQQRAAAKAKVDAADAELKQVESQIMEHLGDAEVAINADGEVRVTWKSQSRSSIDTKALKGSHPELVDEFTKTTSFRVLRMKESK